MCNPEIKQDYAVLRAFRDAPNPIGFSELRSRVKTLLNKIGHSEVEDLADRDLAQVLLALNIGEYATEGDDHKYSLTKEGRSMLRLLETYVAESQPELAA